MKKWILFIGMLMLAPQGFARSACYDFFLLETPPAQEIVWDDPRLTFSEQRRGGLLEVGSGNSGTVFLFKNGAGEFQVAKIYKPERADNLVRDHQGLRYVQKLFDLDSFHSMNFKVASSEIVQNFNGVQGQRALVMPYVPGFNLHSLLLRTPADHPLHEQAVQLYNGLVRELDSIAVRMGIVEEIRPETHKYFQDHIVDGQPVLILEGQPRILIKTDNIIFNPEDNSLTLVDPY